MKTPAAFSSYMGASEVKTDPSHAALPIPHFPVFSAPIRYVIKQTRKKKKNHDVWSKYASTWVAPSPSIAVEKVPPLIST